MIYTLTTNPAIDMNIKLDSKIQAKVVNRCSKTIYSPNGKGINVTLVLKHYNIESKVLGFFGGFSGRFILENLEKRDIKVIPVNVEENTRINIFLNNSNNEYKILTNGSYIKRNKQEEMLRIIDNLQDVEYLCISGSLPPGIDAIFYDEILKLCQKKNVKVILDISSNKLKDLLKYKPYLIKPNDEEIKDIFGMNISNESDIKDILLYLSKQGARNILLTMGDKGLYFYNGKNIYFANAQKVNLVSSACAGDSCLAAFMSKWLFDDQNIEEALKFASATGANVAESDGIGKLENIDSYVKNIKVRKII